MALRPDSSSRIAPRRVPAGGGGKDLQQEVFLREVDDAVRQDQLLETAQKWGRPLAAALVAGLVGLAGWLWYGNHRQGLADAQGEAFTQALDQVEAGNLVPADKSLEALGKDANPGYAAASQMLRAGIAAEQKKPDEAAKLLEAVAADGKAPQPWRDLATVRLVALRFDAMSAEAVIDKLSALAQPGSAWHGPAGELVGLAYLKQGNTKAAGPVFAGIARDTDVPESLRARARQIAGTLGIDTVDDPGKAAGAVAP